MLLQLLEKMRTLAKDAQHYQGLPPEGECIVKDIAEMECKLTPRYMELYHKSTQLALDTKHVVEDVTAKVQPATFILERLRQLQQQTEWVVCMDGQVFIETTTYRNRLCNDERMLKQAEESSKITVKHLWEEHCRQQYELEMQSQRMHTLSKIPFAWAIMELQSLREGGKGMRQRLDEMHRKVRQSEEYAQRLGATWARVRGLSELAEKLEGSVQNLANGASILKGHLDETLHILCRTEEAKIMVVFEAYAQALALDASDIERLIA